MGGLWAVAYGIGFLALYRGSPMPRARLLRSNQAMQSTVRTLVLGALVAASASLQAQCYEPNTGASLGVGDDVVFGMQPLGFAFALGGVTYTNIHVTTNGFVYLSNAGVPAAGGADYLATAAALVAGSPRIAPYWSDLDVIAANGAGVKFNALPGKTVITWENAIEYGDAGGNRFSVQMQLLATGEIYFAYDGRCAVRTAGDFVVGMSRGGGVVVPAASNFSTVNVTAITTNFEIFNSGALPLDLAGKTIRFAPAGLGYAWVPQTCGGSHASYGSGCYKSSDSFYQLTVAPAASSAALSNTAITMIPNGTGYTVIQGGSVFVAPSIAATALVLADDNAVATPTLTTAFPFNGGTAVTLNVCSNGFVSATAGNPPGYAPVVATMLSNLQTAWYSYHDYNPTAVGSGQVKFEQVGSVAYITWDGVFNYGGTTAADASRFQFQFDCASGIVRVVYQTVSANAHTGFSSGEPHLVGYSPGGASNDLGSTTFATGLPLTFTAQQMSNLSLVATGAPVSRPTLGSTITYMTSNIPEFAPASGLHVAINILSVAQVPAPGLDLGFLGAPGCAALVASLDITQAMVGASASAAVTLVLPAGLPPGFHFFSQSAALFTPNSLPNGQNAFGLTTSNAIATVVGAW